MEERMKLDNLQKQNEKQMDMAIPLGKETGYPSDKNSGESKPCTLLETIVEVLSPPKGTPLH
jgi:hypothetical protein